MKPACISGAAFFVASYICTEIFSLGFSQPPNGALTGQNHQIWTTIWPQYLTERKLQVLYYSRTLAKHF